MILFIILDVESKQWSYLVGTVHTIAGLACSPHLPDRWVPVSWDRHLSLLAWQSVGGEQNTRQINPLKCSQAKKNQQLKYWKAAKNQSTARVW